MLPEGFLIRSDYPSFHGIVDTRDPSNERMAYGSVSSKEEDYQIACILADAYANASVEDLIRLQWNTILAAKSDLATPHRWRWKALFDRWVRDAISAISEPSGSRIARLASTGLVPRLDDAVFLDVGCGYGTSLAAVSPSARYAVGIDYSLSNLVVCKKHIESRGLTNVDFVCADACNMPFHSSLFSHVIAESTLEHIREWVTAVREMVRVTAPQGTIYFRVPNRYSLMPEEHVGIWGVGFLPRAWQRPIVKRLMGIDAFTETYLRSRREIRKGLRAASDIPYRLLTSRFVDTIRRSGWRATFVRFARHVGAFDSLWPSIEVVMTKRTHG